MSHAPQVEQVFQLLQEHIKAVDPAMDLSRVTLNTSLTNELGMDSLRLASLFDRIRQNHDGVNLLPWFMSAAQKGGDSLESLALFLIKASENGTS